MNIELQPVVRAGLEDKTSGFQENQMCIEYFYFAFIHAYSNESSLTVTHLIT